MPALSICALSALNQSGQDSSGRHPPTFRVMTEWPSSPQYGLSGFFCQMQGASPRIVHRPS